MSKRKLRELVEKNYVSGWDDPRMPTLCGLRRRGYTPKSIRSFIEQIGVSKVNSIVEYGFLEHCLRDDLNETAERTMCVLKPVKLVITNYPEGLVVGAHCLRIFLDHPCRQCRCGCCHDDVVVFI